MSSYNKAVETLAKGITGKNNSLNNQERTELARELLHTENPQNHSEWKNIEIDLDPQETRVMAQYSRKLEESYSQESGKNISDTLQKVDKTTNLRETLQQEIKQALNETKELEKIAKRLQDKGIGRIAGKEEDQVNKLGEDLERVNRAGKELEKDKQKITQILEKHNLDQSDLHDELGRRASAVETILQASGSGSEGSSENLDQTAQEIVNHELELEKLESIALENYEKDINELKKAIEHKKEEIKKIGKVRDLLQEYNKTDSSQERNNLIKAIVNKLTEIKTDRENIMGGNTLEEFIQDRKEAKNILKGIGELHNRIHKVENQGKKDKLIQKISDKSNLNVSRIESIVEDINRKYQEVEVEINEINKLENENIELDEEALAKTKQLFEAGERAVRHLNGKREELFKQIFDDLRYLGKEIEKNIELEEGTTVLESFEDPFDESWEEYRQGGSNQSKEDSEEIFIDQLAQKIYNDREKLQKFEQRAQKDFEQERDKLSELIQHKKREVEGLKEVHNHLQKGDIGKAESELDAIEDDRKDILGKDSVQNVLHDVEELKNIFVEVEKFFKEIEKVDQAGRIKELENAIASHKGVSEDQAKQLIDLRDQKQKYLKLKDEISTIKDLEKENLGLDKKEYSEVKKLYGEESELTNQINDPSYQQIFNRIHSELEKLGQEIEHDIEIEGGSTGTDTQTSDTTIGGSGNSRSKNGPDPDGDPWIVSLSDIESWPEFLIESLKMVNKKYKPIIDFSEPKPKWAGNNYKLIINGDLIQHGRHHKDTDALGDTKELIEILRSIVNSAEEQTKDGFHPVQFTVGNHDPNLITGKTQAYPDQEEMKPVNKLNFKQTYRRWIQNRIVRSAIKGYNFTYVHAGQAHEWTQEEINRANNLLENLNTGRKDPFHNSPDLNKLANISTDSIDENSLTKQSIIFSLEEHGKDKYKNWSNLNESSQLGDFSKKELLEAFPNARFLGLSRIKFKHLKSTENKYSKLLGTGDGEQRSIHAGMVWARTQVVKNGPPQIVGHSGQNKPTKMGNIIVENTSANKKNKKSNYSVVIETKNRVFSLVGDQSGNISRESF